MRVQFTVPRDGQPAGAVVDVDDAEGVQLIRDGLARESKARSTSKSRDTEDTEE